MALGAALPPLVGAVGPRRSVRVAVAVLMTAVAVVLAYGGGQLFAQVASTKPPLPAIPQIVTGLGDDPADDDKDGGGGGEKPTGGALVQREGPLGIQVDPGSITCDSEDPCTTVTVTSVGSAPLRITWLKVPDDAASYLTATGCENATLEPGASCTITLGFSPQNAPESAVTQLTIHQNFTGPATHVPMEIRGTSTVPLNLALSSPTCLLEDVIEDPETGTVSGSIRIQAPLTATGLPEGPAPEATVSVGPDAPVPATVDLAAGQVVLEDVYEGAAPTEVVVVIDPDDMVQESSEDDNVVSCTVP